MKLFANKKIFKKIVIMLVTIMLITTLMPLHQVSADADEDFGGALFKPIMQFFATIGDLFVEGLQWIFMGDPAIKTDEIPELKSSEYLIRYSPGVIFSNKVPGLDANFINPMKNQDVVSISGQREDLGSFPLDDGELKTAYGFDENTATHTIRNLDAEWFLFVRTSLPTVNEVYEWYYQDKLYILVSQKVDENALDPNDMTNYSLWGSAQYSYAKLQEFLKSKANFTLYRFDTKPTKTGVELESTASQLQGTVAKWYKALRLVSLVALLSVLVYVGIRIIISSTGQEKAKYKKMIGDWVAAICILFILNYIMAFTMEIVQQITQVFSVNIVGENGIDTLMSGIRNCINSNQYSSLTSFTYLILYLVLVVYTVVFTIHYLKRVVYLAFFTMIAPLIAVTYPIDKIKDGQAQAFGTWIKEYAFNAAIPVIHIIIYFVLVGSAADLAEKNPLYAIVCISFLIPAEKFFKKLFGFDKASTVSQLGAAAGGALVMNAINKMGQKSGKQAAEKAGRAGNNPRISRTPSANAAMIGVGASGGESPDGGASGGGSSGGGTPGGGTSPAGPSTGTIGNLGTQRNMGVFGPRSIKAPISGKERFGNGMGAVGRRFVNKNTLKKAGRMVRRVGLGAVGSGLGAAAGIAIGLSTGDLSNAFKYGAIGTAAGYKVPNYAGDKVISAAGSVKRNVIDTYREGAIGQNEFNNIKADKEFYQSAEFRNMVNNRDLLPGKQGRGRTAAMRKEIQTYRDNGITDTGKISTAMRLGLDAQQGAYAIRLANIIGRSGWNNKNVREDFEKRYRGNIPAGTDADKIWNSIEDLL